MYYIYRFKTGHLWAPHDSYDSIHPFEIPFFSKTGPKVHGQLESYTRPRFFSMVNLFTLLLFRPFFSFLLHRAREVSTTQATSSLLSTLVVLSILFFFFPPSIFIYGKRLKNAGYNSARLADGKGGEGNETAGTSLPL